MMNPNVRRRKFGAGTLLYLFIFGVMFTGGGLFALQSNKVDPSWTKTTGQIVDTSSRTRDDSTTYSPVITYEVQGQSYRVLSNSGSSSYPTIGAEREVAYNPARPDQSKVVETASTQGFLYLFPALGILVMIAAPVAFVISRKRSHAITRLVQSGQKLPGVLVDIQTTGSSNSSDSNNFTITVAAADPSGAVHNYVSDSLGGVGGLAMADFRNSPISIDVYVDPTNPQNYYVDISDVPNLTPERIVALIKSAATSQQPNTIMPIANPTVAPAPFPAPVPLPPILPTPPNL